MQAQSEEFYMKSFTTLFFKWVQLGDIWVAKDPIDDQRRWILQLRSSNRFYLWQGFWAKSKIMNLTKEGDKFEEVAWKCFIHRLNQITDIVYNLENVYEKEDVEKAQQVINLLDNCYSLGKFVSNN